MRGCDRILRHHAAIVFHLDFKVVVREYLLSQIKNPGEARGIETMIEIAGHISLQQACLGCVVQRPAAVDKALGDMTDFGDVKMSGNLIATGQNKARQAVGVSAESYLQIIQFHSPDIFLSRNIVKEAVSNIRSRG